MTTLPALPPKPPPAPLPNSISDPVLDSLGVFLIAVGVAAAATVAWLLT